MSVLLVAILVIGVVGLITAFSKFTRQDLVGTCLVQAASSGIEAKRANPTTSSIQIACGGYTINVTITGNPPSTAPPMGSGQSACAEVTATATVTGRTMILRDVVCNFPQG
ncbi:MAG: hypothetical protein N3F66_15210 [Spirochaetes bacterium]|nr:hypothetical protein [Spirochaetota bacterium]